MNQVKFINRKKDIEHLTNFIKINTQENRINIVYAKSGVGKSAFTRKVLQQQNYRFPINIELNDGQYSEGKVIEYIAEQLDISSKHENNICSFSHFIDEPPSKELKKRIFNIFRNSFNSTIPLAEFANKGLDYLMKTGQFDHNLLFNSSITEFILIHKAYIQHNIKQSPLVINIQNAQSIDKTSLKLIRDINEFKISSMFILEYTTNGKYIQINREPLAKYLQSDNTIVEQFDLSKLNFEDYLKIITSKGIDKSTLETILKYTYVKFDGDLRNLTDTEIILSVNQDTLSIIHAVSNDTFNPQQRNLESLNNDEAFILCALVAHGSNLSISDILNFFKSKEVRQLPLDIDLCLDRLDSHKFINRNGGNIVIEHDSIAASIKQDQKYYRYLFLSHKIWSEHYSSIIKSGKFTHISKEKALFQLFQSLIHYSPSSLNSIVSDIRSIVVNVIRPDIAIDYLESLKNIIPESTPKQHNKLYHSFLEMYYHLGIYDKAEEIIELIKEDGLSKSLYRAIILNRLDKFDEAVDYIKKQLSTSSNIRFVFCMNLILLITYRSMSMNDMCLKIYNGLIKNKAYQDLLEFGYLLRNSEIVLSLDESIENAIRSVSFFEKRKMDVQVGHSKITLGMLFAWRGELDKGFKEMEDAEQKLFGNTLERHIIYNDKAAIMLYQKKYNEEVEDYLNEAKITALTSFDKIAIYINMLILYKNQQRYDRCESIISIITEWLNVEKDKIVHRLSYYHFSWYYRSINSSLSENYLDKAKEINASIDLEYNLYWKHRIGELTDKSQLTIGQKFLLEYEYEPFFISYWHFEIPENFD